MRSVTILHDEPGLIVAETDDGIVACRSVEELLAWGTRFQQFEMTREQSAELVELMQWNDRISREGASVDEREALEMRRTAFFRSVAALRNE